jgi:hypothetical protein
MIRPIAVNIRTSIHDSVDLDSETSEKSDKQLQKQALPKILANPGIINSFKPVIPDAPV